VSCSVIREFPFRVANAWRRTGRCGAPSCADGLVVGSGEAVPVGDGGGAGGAREKPVGDGGGAGGASEKPVGGAMCLCVCFVNW